MKTSLLVPVEPRAAAARRWSVPALALALAIVTTLFRIATLGGSLGGFDDDHFVSFAYAKQVQAGELPLRDFQGISLSGMWPQVGFLTSAAAQDLFGNNLRTEAWVSAIGMGIGAALTFVAAARFSPLTWSAAATMLAVLLAPKLYGYSKVVVLAGGALLLISYATRPSAARAGALGALTAVAFLYRHDFAVYVGAGVLATLAAVWLLRGGRPAAHLAVYVAVTVALLTPSLVFAQRHQGLASYFAFAVENSTREAARTELSLPVFSMAPEDVEQNAMTWLYAVFMLLPAAALVQAIRPGAPLEPWRRAALAGIAVTAIAANLFMLRSNLGARFGDVAPLAAILAPAFCLPPRRPDRTARLARASAMAAAAAITAASVWVVGSAARELATAEWPNWPVGLVRRAAAVSSQLAALPSAARDDPDAADAMLVAQYVNHCTQPRDRILQLSYTPEVLPLADRRFAGGIAVLLLTANTPGSDAFVLARVQSESVPLVLAESDQLEPVAGRDPTYFPRLHAYIRERYRHVGTLHSTGEDVHILAEAARTPTGAFRDTGLPCFR